jgi:uncharacterized protein YlzI (FlbEa/FlbD family)
MTIVIKLTTIDEHSDATLSNISEIENVEPTGEGTVITYKSGRTKTVRESPDDIFTLIHKQQKSVMEKTPHYIEQYKLQRSNR